MTYQKSAQAKDLRDHDRIIMATGEQTGHAHQVIATDQDVDLLAADFFEEPDGRRILLVTRPCVLTHQEHGLIALDPERPVQIRQGDVLLHPIGTGAWEVKRQREYSPEAIRSVAD